VPDALPATSGAASPAARLGEVEALDAGVEATGVTVLLVIALSNSWQLVLTHDDGSPA